MSLLVQEAHFTVCGMGLLIPWCLVLLEELTVAQLLTKITNVL
jgi:hypothetical protein